MSGNIQVNVKYYGRLRGIIKNPMDTLELVEGSTLRNLVATLSEKYGPDVSSVFFDEAGNLRETLPVFVVSGKSTRDITTTLQDRCTVVIMPSLAGG